MLPIKATPWLSGIWDECCHSPQAALSSVHVWRRARPCTEVRILPLHLKPLDFIPYNPSSPHGVTSTGRFFAFAKKRHCSHLSPRGGRALPATLLPSISLRAVSGLSSQLLRAGGCLAQANKIPRTGYCGNVALSPTLTLFSAAKFAGTSST